MKLGILSHTEHCLVDGVWNGLSPTVREIDRVSEHFDQVIHAGCAYSSLSGCQVQPYSATNVRFVPMRPAGGDRLIDKLSIVFAAPRNLQMMMNVVRECDAVQVRLPTGMGLYLLPALRMTGASNCWAKYAGNWVQDDPPWSYVIQRWWLRRFFRGPVTVNGNWSSIEPHFHAFENPCLTEDEVKRASEEVAERVAKLPVTFCFVGRLEKAKGMERIIEALGRLPESAEIDCVHFVGDGEGRAQWEGKAAETGVRCVFHGTLGRDELAKIYAASNYLLLPSDSEGFPKVIAEAAAFGVVPVVSAVSAIPQYVNSRNGFLWPVEEPFSEWFLAQDFYNLQKLRMMSAEIKNLAGNFTYERYCARLVNEVLPKMVAAKR